MKDLGAISFKNKVYTAKEVDELIKDLKEWANESYASSTIQLTDSDDSNDSTDSTDSGSQDTILVLKDVYTRVGAIETRLPSYQPGLSFDTKPTEGSTNPVTSGGVFQAINDSVSKVYRYKGSVASASNLPESGNVVGDVYNVLDTGSNYAWDGTAWDDLAGMVDLTDYVKTDDTRLSDAREPLSHASSHAVNGSDPITPLSIGAVPADDDTITVYANQVDNPYIQVSHNGYGKYDINITELESVIRGTYEELGTKATYEYVDQQFNSITETDPVFETWRTTTPNVIIGNSNSGGNGVVIGNGALRDNYNLAGHIVAIGEQLECYNNSIDSVALGFDNHVNGTSIVIGSYAATGLDGYGNHNIVLAIGGSINNPAGVRAGQKSIVVGTDAFSGNKNNASNFSVVIGASAANDSSTQYGQVGHYNIAIGGEAKIATTENNTCQIGKGRNINGGTLQFRDWTVLNSSGNIPTERFGVLKSALSSKTTEVANIKAGTATADEMMSVLSSLLSAIGA